MSISHTTVVAWLAAGLLGCGAHAQVVVGTSGTGELRSFQSLQQPAQVLVVDPLATGGIRVAMGDVDGDGDVETIAATGPGTIVQVAVFDTATHERLRTIFLPPPASSLTSGAYVAAGDVNGDGRAEIVVAAGGSAWVFDGVTGNQVTEMFSPLGLRFGLEVRIACADVDGDGRAEIIAASGPGGPPRVVAIDVASRATLLDFNAYAPSAFHGVFVAAADLTGDGIAEIITGPDEGGEAIVRFFDPTDMDNPVSRRVAPEGNMFGVRVGTVWEIPPEPDPEPQQLVVIAIIAILIGLLVPAIQKIDSNGMTQQEWIGPAELAGQFAYVAGRPAPTPPLCAADFNGDGVLDPDDLGDFINCYFAIPACDRTDFNADGTTDPDDLGDYINAYFAGC